MGCVTLILEAKIYAGFRQAEALDFLAMAFLPAEGLPSTFALTAPSHVSAGLSARWARTRAASSADANPSSRGHRRT